MVVKDIVAPSVRRMRVRLAIVVSHPIQHFCPQYSSWARLDGVDLRVFFASRQGLDTYHDKDFAEPVRWEGLALDFPHEFLPGAGDRPVTAALDAPEAEERLAGFRPHAVCVYGYAQPLQAFDGLELTAGRFPAIDGPVRPADRS